MYKTPTNKIIHKRAFSLIELSLVVVAISLCIVGIMAGGVLLKRSNLSSARSLTIQSPILAIPNLVTWYESSTAESFIASQIIDGKQITTWYNLEPEMFLEKNNLTTTASANVLYEDDSINSLPAVNMNIVGNMKLDNFASYALNTSTVVIVFKPTAAITSGTFYTIFDSGASTNTVSSISITDNRVRLDASGTPVDSSTVINPAAFTTNGMYILVVYFNGASSKVFVNNIIEAGGSGAVLSPGANALDGITVGANKSGASGIAAEISEVIVYGRVLKDSERQDIVSYLSKKYKITVTGL